MSTDQPDDSPPPLSTPLTRLFRIRYPIIQAGMVWTAGCRLAVAVSEAGGLGLIGAGSMKPDHAAAADPRGTAGTQLPFGVNIPLARGDAGELVDVRRLKKACASSSPLPDIRRNSPRS